MSEIEITAYKCKSCGRVHYPKHERCLNCKNREFEPVSPQGNAKLLAYTQIFNLPWGFDERFLIMGVGEFENGVKAMGHIKVNTLSKLKTGMQLEADWEPVRHEASGPVYGLVFRPLK